MPKTTTKSAAKKPAAKKTVAKKPATKPVAKKSRLLLQLSHQTTRRNLFVKFRKTPSLLLTMVTKSPALT